MSILPESLKLAACNLSSVQGKLLKEEQSLLEGATPTRQRELIAGRHLARQAMAELGCEPSPITQGPGGAARWPRGICGSISHSASHVAVAIGPASALRSVGVDIEDGRDLDSAIDMVGRQDEIDGLAEHPLAGGRASAGRMLFSAKEALYKCQFPLTGNATLDFLDIAVGMDVGGRLNAGLMQDQDALTRAIIPLVKILFVEIQSLTVAVAWIGTN